MIQFMPYQTHNPFLDFSAIHRRATVEAQEFGLTLIEPAALLMALAADSKCDAAKLMLHVGVTYEGLQRLLGAFNLQPLSGGVPFSLFSTNALQMIAASLNIAGEEPSAQLLLCLLGDPICARMVDTVSAGRGALLANAVRALLTSRLIDQLFNTSRQFASAAVSDPTPNLSACSIDLSEHESIEAPLRTRSAVYRCLEILQQSEPRRNIVIVEESALEVAHLIRSIASLLVHSTHLPATLRGKRVKMLKTFPDALQEVAGELSRSSAILFSPLYVSVPFANDRQSFDGAAFTQAMRIARVCVEQQTPCILSMRKEDFLAFWRADAVAQYFEPVVLEPLQQMDLLDVLYDLRPRAERHHKVQISDEALYVVARNSHSLDEAVNLLEKAAARSAWLGAGRQITGQDVIQTQTSLPAKITDHVFGFSPGRIGDAAVGVQPNGKRRQ